LAEAGAALTTRGGGSKSSVCMAMAELSRP
jgi:hypothetical protein